MGTSRKHSPLMLELFGKALPFGLEEREYGRESRCCSHISMTMRGRGERLGGAKTVATGRGGGRGADDS